MSRRLASLPSVAPFGVPSRSMTRASSGSGLFQVEMPEMPTSEPWPTLLSSGPLVNTSGWAPSPTWRYWDQRPFSRSTPRTARASSEPGRTSWIELPMLACSCSRSSAARVMSPPTRSSMTRSSMLRTNVTPAALMTCRSTGESSAGRSRATGASAPRRRSASLAVAASTSARLQVSSCRAVPSAAQTSAAGSSRSIRSAIVGPSPVTSWRRSPATATSRGPRPGAHNRPTSTARPGVRGSVCSALALGSSTGGVGAGLLRVYGRHLGMARPSSRSGTGV